MREIIALTFGISPAIQVPPTTAALRLLGPHQGTSRQEAKRGQKTQIFGPLVPHKQRGRSRQLGTLSGLPVLRGAGGAQTRRGKGPRDSQPDVGPPTLRDVIAPPPPRSGAPWPLEAPSRLPPAPLPR